MPAVDAFAVSLDEDAHTLRINIPDLRRTAKVKVIVQTASPTEIKTMFVADRGRIYDFEIEDKEKARIRELFLTESEGHDWLPMRKLLEWVAPHTGERLYSSLRYPELYRLINPLITGPGKTTKEIELEFLSDKLIHLKSDYFLKAAWRFVIPDMFHFLFLVLIGCIIVLAVESYKRHINYKSILSIAETGVFKLGDPLVDVVKLLDAPFYMAVYDPAIVGYDLTIGFCPRKAITSNSENNYHVIFRLLDSHLIEIRDTGRNIALPLDSDNATPN